MPQAAQQKPSLNFQKVYKKPSLSIYIHIPYCQQHCSYCDFVTLKEGDIQETKDYIETLKKEIQNQAYFFSNIPIETIYFGGGTPSLLSASEIKSILDEIQKIGPIQKSAEVTIEVNPGTLPDKKLSEYQQAGINRFSLGVQTFTPWFLKKSGRMHSVEDSLKDLQRLQSQASNFSLDLMFGLPHQNLESLKKDVYQALFFEPQHISLYNLTLPSRHQLNKDRPLEEEQIKMFHWLEETLQKHGLIRYEISNFGKSGFFSRHNQAYWKGKTILALGISAHSYLSPDFLSANGSNIDNDYGIRFWNSSHMETYVQQVLQGEQQDKSSLKSPTPFSHLKSNQTEILKPFESLTEFCYIRLRTIEGLSLIEMQALYPAYWCDLASQKIEVLKQKDYLIQDQDTVTLTAKGKILSNQVFLDLTFLSKDL